MGESNQKAELFQSILDASNLRVAVYKAVRNDIGEIVDFMHEYVNRKTLETLGQDFTGRLLSAHGPDGIKQIELFKQVIYSGQANEYTLKAASGVVDGWFHFSNTPMGADRLLHTWQDVAGPKKAEQEILRLKDEIAQKAESKLQSAIDLARLSLFEWNPITGQLNWDERCRAMWGLPPDALVDYDVFLAGIHPDDRLFVESLVAQSLDPAGNGRYEAEYRVIGIDDKIERWVLTHGRVIFDETGRAINFIGAAQDITERKNAEEALKISEEKYRAVFETMIEACCIFEMIYDDLGRPVDWRILEANAGYERQSGLKDVAGKLASEVMPGTEPYWIETFNRVVQTGEAEQIEKWHQPTKRWIHSSTARVGGPGSKRLVSVFYDITERKKAEEALRNSEETLKNLVKLRDEFIGIASHELNTPVTSLKVYAEIVQEGMEMSGSKDDIELLFRLNAQIDRLSSLISNLLDTTRFAEGRLQLSLEELDLNELIRERTDEIGRTTKHEFDMKLSSLPKVVADRERIGQVITNLLSNAVKYSPKGTTITVSTELEAATIKASIQDRGYGIPENDIPKVFDRFFRVTANKMDTYPGMGLGLYITAQIIERHGGHISVESKLGTGSKFSFNLPLQSDKLSNE